MNNIIKYNWNYVTADGHGGEEARAAWLAKNQIFDKRRFYHYDDKTVIVPGWLSWWTDEERERFGLEKKIYFLKWHNLMPDRWFAGESVLQMVRHPVSASWSWHRLSVDEGNSMSALDLAVKGQGGLKGYTEYYSSWLRCSPPPPPPHAEASVRGLYCKPFTHN